MHKDNEPQDGFREIQPAPFQGVDSPAVSSKSKSSVSIKALAVGLGFAILLFGIFVVIFFLPGWVETEQSLAENNQGTLQSGKDNVANSDEGISTQVRDQNQTAGQTGTSETKPRETQTNRTPSSTSTTQTAAPTAAPTISPVEQARLSELRKEAQSLLQDILEKQKTLEDNNTKVWAEEEFLRGLAHANSGDQLYKQQQFEQSVSEYEQSLAIYNALSDRIDIIYQESLARGQEALDTGDTLTALDAFKTAALFVDESGQARKGLERAEKLDEVFSHIDTGNEALDNNELDNAKSAYQTALELDSETKIAQEKLSETNRRIANRQFNRHMTSGYAALDKQQFHKARSEFNQALRIKTNSSEAKNALEQTTHQETTFRIANALQQASEAEKQEEWQRAIELYDEALKLESNLAQAQTGKQRAELQLQTSQRLQQILVQADRLSDEKVYAEIKSFHNAVSRIQNPGPKLAKQISDVGRLLQVSATPIKIRLESDNATDVTVFKVGKMGTFAQRELSLRPGKYTAVGQRDGYRDVRIEFLVSATDNNQVVRVAANQKIN